METPTTVVDPSGVFRCGLLCCGLDRMASAPFPVDRCRSSHRRPEDDAGSHRRDWGLLYVEVGWQGVRTR